MEIEPFYLRSKGLRVSRKLIMKKATIIYEDLRKGSDDEDLESDFKASTGWLRQFLQRAGFSLRRKTSMAQKDPERLIDKLVSFVITVQR